MPDYIDQLFDANKPQEPSGPAGAELESALIKDNEELVAAQQPQQTKVLKPQQSPVQTRQQVRGGQDMIQTGAKWVERNIGIPLEDTIDNLFQGNKRTPDQVARDRAKRDQDMAGQLGQQKTINDLPGPAKAALAPVIETGRTIAGAATGAAESTLNTLEFAADLGRAINPFAHLAGIPEKDNVFSNKYEWARWDLGRSEVGAQTGPGKVAQDILEFAALAAGTGGFGTLKGLPSLLKSTPGVLGKTGLLLKSGGYQALRSSPAELAIALRGEGGLSNTLREAGLPEWATPLAVDENDSGVTLAAKGLVESGLIGLPLSMAADAIEPLFKGRRMFAALKQGGATDEDATTQSIREVQESLRDTLPNAQSARVDISQYQDAVQISTEANPQGAWRTLPVPQEALTTGRPISTQYISGVLDANGELHGITGLEIAEVGEWNTFAQRMAQEGVTNFSVYRRRPGQDLDDALEALGYREVATSSPSWDDVSSRGLQGYANQEELATHGPRVSHYVLDPNADFPSRTHFASLEQGLEYQRTLARDVPDLDLGSITRLEEVRRLPPEQQLIWYDRQANPPSFYDLGVGAQIAREGRAVRIQQLANGSKVKFLFTEQRQGLSQDSLLNPIPTIEVEFGVTGQRGIENYGKHVVTWFNRVARDEIAPGTVLINTPATNGYGRGRSAAQVRREAIDPEFRRRETLYRRAGFSPGIMDREGRTVQYAVVRHSPTGSGKFLEPLRVELDQRRSHDYFANIGDVHQQILAQRNPYRLAQEFLRISGNNTAARSAGVTRLMRNSSMGIPVTWDDTASVVPELFTAGTRDIGNITPDLTEFISYMDSRLRNGVEGGRVMDPFTNTQITEGYAVAIDGVELTDFSQEAVDSFFARNSQIFTRTDTALEGIVRDGALVIRPVRLIDDATEAVGLGVLFDQPFIARASDGRQSPTYGIDNLRFTQGQHLASTYGVPVEPRLVTPTEALADQLATQSLMNGRRMSRRTVTQAQIRQIATATSEGAGNLLRRMVQQNPIDLTELSEISRRTEEEIVMDAWRGMQDALDENFNVDLTQLLTQDVAGDTLLSRAGIVQVRGLMQELANQMYESAGPIMQMIDNNVDAVPAFSRLADNLKALMRIHKVSANVYGNMLRAYQIPIPLLGGVQISVPGRALSPEALARELRNADEALDGIVRRMADADPEARQAGFRLLNALVMAEGDVSKMATLGKWMDKLAWGKGLSIFYNSILSGPKTQLTNLVSNAVNTVYRPIAAATGGNAAVKKAAAASFHNFQQTIFDSFDVAWRSMKDGAVNEGDKGILQAAQADLQLQILRKSAEVSDDLGFKAGVGFLDMMDNISRNPWLSWPSKFLTGGDEFFKTMVSRMEYNSRTMMKAIEEAQGSDEPVKDVFERLYRDNYDRTFDPDTGKILDDDLLDISKEVTFQTDLEGAAKAFGDFITEVPALRIFFPFVKTGHNIMVYAGTHVPVLGRYLSEYKAVMAGEDEYAKAVMRGRQAWGTMLVLGASLAAHNGMITGNGPPDPEERKLWLLQHPARSIRVGDKWVDYSRIEPYGWILSSVADLYDMTQRGRLSEDRGKYLAGYLTYAIAANFTNKSYMQGVVPLGKLLTPGWQGIDVLTKLPVDTINSLLPLAGVRSTVANMLTPYQQEYNETLDRSLFRGSGGLAKLGSPMYDWLDSSMVENPNGGFNALNPIAIRSRKSDVVRDALEDIGFDNSVISKTLSGVKLQREHRSRMQQLMGQSNLHKELKAWVTNPNFGPAVKDFKARLAAGERVYKDNEPFYNEIVRIILRHRDNAVAQVRQEFPELQQDIRERQILKDSQRRPQVDVSTIDLDRIVNMPK